jgi:hypothetical protein
VPGYTSGKLPLTLEHVKATSQQQLLKKSADRHEDIQATDSLPPESDNIFLKAKKRLSKEPKLSNAITLTDLFNRLK